MRNRNLLLPVLTAALLTLTASAAQAGPFVLTLTDVTNAQTIVVEDLVVSGGPDLNTSLGSIAFIGKVGTFDVRFFANTYTPGPSGAPVQMNVSNFRVVSASAGQFTATLSRTDLSPLALGLGPSVDGIGTVGATLTGAPGTMTFQSWVNGTTVFDPAKTVSGTGGNGTSTSSPVLLGGDFALLSRLEFNFQTGGTMTGTSDLQVYTGATPVPEPITLLLLGTGLFGFIGFTRRYPTAL